MSFHMHLRSMSAEEVPEDFASLFDFMWAFWKARKRKKEFARGIAEYIEKDFGSVDQIYTGATCHGEVAGAPNPLPVYGGRLVPDPAGDHPPFVILDPADVRKTSQFLQTASFDGFWQAASAELARPYLGLDETEVKEIFLGYHDRLRTFYGRAAMAGHAVVKAFWY